MFIWAAGEESKISSPYTGPSSVAASCSVGLRKTLRKCKLLGEVQVQLLYML